MAFQSDKLVPSSVDVSIDTFLASHTQSLLRFSFFLWKLVFSPRSSSAYANVHKNRTEHSPLGTTLFIEALELTIHPSSISSLVTYSVFDLLNLFFVLVSGLCFANTLKQFNSRVKDKVGSGPKNAAVKCPYTTLREQYSVLDFLLLMLSKVSLIVVSYQMGKRSRTTSRQ